MPTISVIVPVYKVEPYLHRCVDSILAQTFTDFELILVDDGSPDNCPAICDEYAKKDSRVHVIHQKNGGLSAARNAGIDWAFANSDSKWLSFVDSDDWVSDFYLEVLYDAAKSSQCRVSMCGLQKTDGNHFSRMNRNEIEKYQILEPEKFYVSYGINGTVACAKLYRKACFQKVRYPVGRLYEDAFVTYRILFELTGVAYVNTALYYYYSNPGGIMQRPFDLHYYDSIEARKERKEYFEQHHKDALANEEANGILIETALNSIKARKAGLYQKVPSQYKMPWVQAMFILNTKLDRNQYEWVVSKVYPNLVKTQAYFRRGLEIIKKPLRKC